MDAPAKDQSEQVSNVEASNASTLDLAAIFLLGCGEWKECEGPVRTLGGSFVQYGVSLGGLDAGLWRVGVRVC
jgi:hypothetical protein